MLEPLPISGYVLAGGQSSRMGRDKALLELAGKPLVEHALTKLRRICTEVAILSNRAGMERFAPVVEDLHPGCGPIGGLEAALAHASHDWSLVLPVDVPFVPSGMLYSWAHATLRQADRHGTRVALFTVDGVPQPTLIMLHQEIAPYLTASLARGRFKLFPELVAAAGDLAAKRGQDPQEVLRQWGWPDTSCLLSGPARTTPSPEQERAMALFFLNLNTPEDFRRAEQEKQLLDP